MSNNFSNISINPKHILFEEIASLTHKFKEQGLKIVQCHGTFDLIHPGHIIHFEEAKNLGDLLIVTITGEEHVNKGPGRPFFNDSLRVKSLTALESIDYVVVIPFTAAVEAINCVKPDIYCKGREYENPEIDVTGNIHEDVKTVEKFGGIVSYVGSITFSSTRLLNKHFETYSPEVKTFCSRIATDYNFEHFKKIVEDFQNLKVLVVGDTIFDSYSTVSVQGLASKNNVISTRFLHDETQAGGAMAVFRHVKQFTPNVKLFSLVGTEPWVQSSLGQYVHSDDDEVIRAHDFTTIVKRRFIQPVSEGKELTKLFSVNYIDENNPNEALQKYVFTKLADQIRDYDLIIVMDFGHGLMEESVRRLVETEAPFLALNCQTNSNNHGFNIINRQYHRADSLSLDQTEMNLACGKQHYEAEDELEKLHISLGAKYSWLTRGAIKTIGLKTDGGSCACEPLEREVIDTIGAGDAFSALASLAAVKGLPVNLATFMGQLAGAIAVRIIGNSDSVTKGKFLKSAEAMLK